MLEAEISPSGAVLVEGHHVGELQGFRFTADQTAEGEDAKAVKAAAQKALALEFEARAERFSASGNNDIALGSDGVLRWIGVPIATLTSGEDVLRPRTILLADEQLTGPARDKVAVRAERFVNFQVETLLKPIVDLKNAEQLTGIGRGIAFQLVENFGLLNRRDIADDVKSLDQEGRGALRRLGVRFGAYHIFIPALLKPGPAGLVTLLWALKNDGKDKPGFGDVVHALAAGRTSVVIDPTYDRAFYRLAGFRNLGRRAVRVDILERLADLIRPALAWRVGTGPRPDGAYDGSAFVVTPAMMSILGATADDIEEILKGLGYRAEPKPAAEVKAKLEALDTAAREAVEKAAAERAKEAADKAAKETAAEEAAASVEPDGTHEAPIGYAGADLGNSSSLAGEVPAEQTEGDGDGVLDSPPLPPAPTGHPPHKGEGDSVAAGPAEFVVAEESGAASKGEGEASAVGEAPEPAAEAAPAEEISTEPAGREAAPAEEPKPILLWRQARFEGRHGQRHGNQRDRGGPRGRHQNAGAAGDAETRTDGKGRRDGGGKERFDRKFQGKPGKPDGQGVRQERRDGGKPGQKTGFQGKPQFQQKPREERPVRVDPDSPFAKLAALRDQLKK